MLVQGDEEGFAGFGAAGFGFEELDAFKVRGEVFFGFVFVAVHEDFGGEMAAFGEVVEGEIYCQFGEGLGAEAIGFFVAYGIGGHVGHHQIGFLVAEGAKHLGEAVFGGEVVLDKGDLGQGVAGEQVYPYRADAFGGGDLGPAAGGAAEVGG